MRVTLVGQNHDKNKTVVDSFVNNEQYYILKAGALATISADMSTSGSH